MLREGATHLQSFHHVDESVFEARGTGHEEETRRFRSNQTSKCLLVLDWHIRQTAGKRQSNRVLLAGLMGSLGMMKRSAEETSADPERWVEKRLERASEEDEARHSQKEYVENFISAPWSRSTTRCTSHVALVVGRRAHRTSQGSEPKINSGCSTRLGERTSQPRAENTRRAESSIGRRWITPRRFSTRVTSLSFRFWKATPRRFGPLVRRERPPKPKSA